MMRKILLFLMLALLSFVPLYAADGTTTTTTGETTSDFVSVSNSVKLSVTVTNRVYVGVTKSQISSSIVPSSDDRISEIKFSFDHLNKKWVTDDAYLYAISFIKQKVKITLTPAKLTSGSSVLPYTLDLTTSSSNCSGKTLTVTSSSSSTALAAFTICDEKDIAAEDLEKPRVMTWRFRMEVDASNSSSTTNQYSADFIMAITSST